MEQNSQTPDLTTSRVMLARLTVNTWSGKRFDRKASAEVADAHSGDGRLAQDIGRFNKRLILKDASEFSRLAAMEARAREAFHCSTLRYDGAGIRLLPVEAYLDFVGEYQRVRADFDAQVDRFLERYPDYQEAARQALNGLYRADDYPTVTELRARYGMQLDVWPFPEAHHFNVDCLSAEAAEAIRAQIETAKQRAFEQSQEEVRKRLFEVVAHMADRLAAVADGGRLHDSALDNLGDALVMLPKLNFLNDPDIDRAIGYARAELSRFTARAIRENRSLCVPAAAAASAVRTRLGSDFAIDLSQFTAESTTGGVQLPLDVANDSLAQLIA